MKKFISSMAALMLVFSLFGTLQAKASYDEDLQKAILTAKNLFNISDEYDGFSYNISETSNRKTFALNWNDADASINLEIDANGNVLSYNKYTPGDYNQMKLPKITKEEGLKTATSFIEKVNKKISGKLVRTETREYGDKGQNYSYSFSRVENGINVTDDNVNVTVSLVSGQVMNYYTNWSDVTFPSTTGVVSKEKAMEAFKNEKGLELVYNFNYTDNARKPYLVYMPMKQFILDAKTGKVIAPNQPQYYGSGMGMTQEMSLSDSKERPTLSPKEQSAVEETKGLVTKEDAENTVRGLLSFSDEYSLTSVNLSEDWNNKGEYLWSLNFETKDGSSCNVSLNAKTKELLNFWIYNEKSYNGNETVSMEKALETAKAALQKYHSSKLKEVALVPVENTTSYKEQVKNSKQYTFTFMRKQNSIPVNGDGVTINVSAVTGEVVGDSLSWYKGPFTEPASIISQDKAYAQLFSQSGLELMYMFDYSKDVVPMTDEKTIESSISAPTRKNDTASVHGKVVSGETPVTEITSSEIATTEISNTASKEMPSRMIMPRPSQNATVKIVYMLSPNKPSMIDPATGQLLNYDGKPYTENKTVSTYTDIVGINSEKIINTLSQMGIGFNSDKFLPTVQITQKDFLMLLNQAKNFYRGDDQEQIYNQSISMGLLKKEEKNPTTTVQKQDAVKYIIRIIGQEKIATLDIYKAPYQDVTDAKYVGYIALAKGLGITSDTEKFEPAKMITREEAAVMIYQLLSAN